MTSHAYLTRQDIATELRISAKQAGRLMLKMPTILVGTKHKRVARGDFDQWISQQKEASVRRSEAAMNILHGVSLGTRAERNHHSAALSAASSVAVGSVMAMAIKMRAEHEKMRSSEKHAENESSLIEPLVTICR